MFFLCLAITTQADLDGCITQQSDIELVLLSQVPGVGPILLNRLIDALGSAAEVLTSSESTLLSINGIGSAIAKRIRHARDHVSLDEILGWCDKHQTKIVTSASEGYPAWLAELADAPAVLFVRGEICPADQFSVAIVGTRHASVYGRQQAERLA